MISRADTFEFPKKLQKLVVAMPFDASRWDSFMPGAKWADPTMHPRTQAGTWARVAALEHQLLEGPVGRRACLKTDSC